MAPKKAPRKDRPGNPILAEASEPQKEEIAMLDADLRLVLEECLVSNEHRALLANRGFPRLDDFVALFDSKADVKERGSRFFRYFPENPARPTEAEAVILKQENGRLERAWEAAKVRMRERDIAREKTDKALESMKSDRYQLFVACQAAQPFCSWLTPPTEGQLVKAIMAYFEDESVRGVEVAMLEAALTETIFEEIQKAITGRKLALQSPPEPEPNSPQGSAPTSPAVAKKAKPATPEEMVKAIFYHWDRDKSGKLELEEFVNLFLFLGMPEEDARKMFAAVDMDNDKAIDYEEFLEWLLFAGKSSFIVGEQELVNVSKDAAKSMRKYGEVQAKKPPPGVIMCSASSSVLATLKCIECKEYFSQAGFDRTHSEGVFREHGVTPLPRAEGAALETLAHNSRAIKLMDAQTRDGSSMRKALEVQLKKQFKAYDLDGNGNITSDELTDIIMIMAKFVGEKKTEAQAQIEAESLFKKLDSNKDGSVELSEFINVLVEDAIDPNSVNYGPVQAKKKSEMMTAFLQEAKSKGGGGLGRIADKSAAPKKKAGLALPPACKSSRGPAAVGSVL